MISNDERREVAARLRKVKSECDERDYPWMAEDLMQALGFSTYEEGEDGIFDRLADLIEPEPERTCHFLNDGHGILWCDAQGCDYEMDDYLPIPKHCPNCGAKVVG